MYKIGDTVTTFDPDTTRHAHPLPAWEYSVIVKLTNVAGVDYARLANPDGSSGKYHRSVPLDNLYPYDPIEDANLPTCCICGEVVPPLEIYYTVDERDYCQHCPLPEVA